MKIQYAVVVRHSFNMDMPVYLFDDYNKASKYLQDMWQYSYNEELANSITPIEEQLTYHEDDYAIITWCDGDCTEFILTCTSEPMRINGKSYK